MNDGLIPRRYAKALYNFAVEKGDADRIYELMKNLAVSFDNEPALQTVLSNPFVSDADKTTLISTASGATADDTVLVDFLKLLSRNKRLDMARHIARSFMDIYRKERNIYVVEVTSAAPMTESGLERLKKLISAHLKGGTMEFNSNVNPDLIGGFTVTVGNERLDASISNELKQLRLNLLSK